MPLCPQCLERFTTTDLCSICHHNNYRVFLGSSKVTVKNRKPIPKISPKKRQREKELKVLRDKKREEHPYCATCGTTDGFISYSHILSVKQFPEFELHPENAIMQCIPCHQIWENGNLTERMAQSTFQYCVDVIMKLAPNYLNLLFKNK